LHLIEDVHEGPCGCGDGKSSPPDGLDTLIIGIRVDHHAGRPAEAAVAARHEQMNLAGDAVAQIEERERALPCNHGPVRPDGHPLLADVIVLGAGEPRDPIQTSPDPFVASLAEVVVEELTADAVGARLGGIEVPALPVGFSFQCTKVWASCVRYRSSIP
jgi:hypothetical protein